MVGGHVASGLAVNGKVDLVWGRSEGAMRVVSHGKGLVQLVSHGLIIRGVSSGGGVEVGAEHSDGSFSVDRRGERKWVGAVGIPEDFCHDVRGGGSHADRVLML